MKTISYVIDPDGDVELVLSEPNLYQIIPKIHSVDSSTHDDDLPDSEFENPPATGRYTVFNELYTKPTATTGTQNVEENHELWEVRMRISSKPMSLVSSLFRDRLLAARYKDASAHCSAGSPSSPPTIRRRGAFGWDAMALAIVLDAIHGRHAEIPRFINLGLLARITTVVDHFKCQEAIQVFFDHWQRHINCRVVFPTTLCRAALLWLYISMVFPGQETVFKSMASAVVMDVKGPDQITARELPIKATLRKFNEKRLDLIQQIKDGLQDVHNSLLQESECNQGYHLCPSLTLGVLTRVVHQHEHADPPFVAPFDGYSVSAAFKLVKECIEPMPLHERPETDMPRYIDPYDGETYPCSIRGRMRPVVQKVEGELYRMRLADFKD